jgi:hypothetical protein
MKHSRDALKSVRAGIRKVGTESSGLSSGCFYLPEDGPAAATVVFAVCVK